MARASAVSRRSILTGIDQGLSSLQNFMFLVIAARSLTRLEFGRLAVALAVTIIVVGISEALFAEPLILLYAASGDDLRREARKASLTLSLAFGILSGGVCAAIALALPGALQSSLLAAAAIVPVLCVQNTARFGCIAAGSPRALLSLDVSWVTTWIVLVTALRPASAHAQLLAWGLSSATFLLLLPLMRLKLTGPRQAMRHARANTLPTGISLLLDYGFTNAADQSLNLALGGIVGIAAVGAMRASQQLLGPLNTLITSARVVVAPEVVRAGGPNSRAGARWVNGTTAVCTTVAIGTSAVLLMLPKSVGHALLGETWESTRVVLPGIALSRILIAINVRPWLSLRVRGRNAALVAARVATSAAVVAAGVIGAGVAGLRGASWGVAAAAALSLVLYWVINRRSAASSGGPLDPDSAVSVKRALDRLARQYRGSDRLSPALQHYIPQLVYQRIRTTALNPYSDAADASRAVYVHIPKTAGTAVYRSLFEEDTPGHLPASHYASYDPAKFESYFKFALVRNPWDRAVSAFHFLKQGGATPNDVVWTKRVLDDYSNFEAFVRGLESLRMRRAVLRWTHFIPQHRFLCDRDGALMVDYIGNFEELDTAIANICERLGRPVPKDLQRVYQSDHRPYWEYYNRESAELIGRLYQRDSDLFGYDFPYDRL